MKLSNCAASTMYMNTMDSTNAMTKLLAARPNSFDLADQAGASTPAACSGHRSSCSDSVSTLLSDWPFTRLAVIRIWRWRL